MKPAPLNRWMMTGRVGWLARLEHNSAAGYEQTKTNSQENWTADAQL